MSIFNSKDNCRLYYECHNFKNNGPVVVFFNGTTQTTRSWWMQTQYFQKKYKILLYDARGQGQSDLGQASLTLDAHVNDLIQLLDYLGVNRTHLVGLSHGARVACRFGAIAPERVDRIVLCGLGINLSPRTAALLHSWNHILNSSSLETLAWSMLPIVFGEPFLEQHKSILNKMVSVVVKRNRADALKAHLRAMIHYLPVGDLISEVYPPTLIVTGNQDLIVQIDQSRALAKKLKAHLIQLKGVGHSPNMEAPEAFNRIIGQFLLTTK